MSEQTFRPRSATEIIDGTFRLYREHFVPLVTLSTVVYLPVIARMIPMLLLMDGMADGSPEAGMALGLVLAAIGLISLLWYPVMWAALMVSISERYLGRDIEAGDAIRRAFGRFGSLLGATLAKWALIMFGFFLLFFPMFYFMARYFAIPATVVIENQSAGQALRRSSQLSINQKGRILGTLLLAWAILIGISMAVSMLVAVVVGVMLAGGDVEAITGTSSMLLQLPSIFAYILGLPVIVITETLLYYDARIRQEGYDIELMSAQLAGPEARAATN